MVISCPAQQSSAKQVNRKQMGREGRRSSPCPVQEVAQQKDCYAQTKQKMHSICRKNPFNAKGSGHTNKGSLTTVW